jgi:hypothetical protein
VKLHAQRLVTPVFEREPGRVVVTIPVLTISIANAGENRFGRARRVQREHIIVGQFLKAAWPANDNGFGEKLAVHLTRLAPRELDSDNLVSSLKNVRDAIAKHLRVDDGPKGPVIWSYEYEKTAAYGVRVSVANR